MLFSRLAVHSDQDLPSLNEIDWASPTFIEFHSLVNFYPLWGGGDCDGVWLRRCKSLLPCFGSTVLRSSDSSPDALWPGRRHIATRSASASRSFALRAAAPLMGSVDRSAARRRLDFFFIPRRFVERFAPWRRSAEAAPDEGPPVTWMRRAPVRGPKTQQILDTCGLSIVWNPTPRLDRSFVFVH